MTVTERCISFNIQLKSENGSWSTNQYSLILLAPYMFKDVYLFTTEYSISYCFKQYSYDASLKDVVNVYLAYTKMTQ